MMKAGLNLSIFLTSKFQFQPVCQQSVSPCQLDQTVYFHHKIHVKIIDNNILAGKPKRAQLANMVTQTLCVLNPNRNDRHKNSFFSRKSSVIQLIHNQVITSLANSAIAFVDSFVFGMTTVFPGMTIFLFKQEFLFFVSQIWQFHSFSACFEAIW